MECLSPRQILDINTLAQSSSLRIVCHSPPVNSIEHTVEIFSKTFKYFNNYLVPRLTEIFMARDGEMKSVSGFNVNKENTLEIS